MRWCVTIYMVLQLSGITTVFYSKVSAIKNFIYIETPIQTIVFEFNIFLVIFRMRTQALRPTTLSKQKDQIHAKVNHA